MKTAPVTLQFRTSVSDTAVDKVKKKKARKAESARHGRAKKKASELARRLIVVELMRQANDLTVEVSLLRSIVVAHGIPLPGHVEQINPSL